MAFGTASWETGAATAEFCRYESKKFTDFYFYDTRDWAGSGTLAPLPKAFSKLIDFLEGGSPATLFSLLLPVTSELSPPFFISKAESPPEILLSKLEFGSIFSSATLPWGLLLGWTFTNSWAGLLFYIF